MKKLKLTETDKKEILQEFANRLEKYDPSDNNDFSFEKKLNNPVADKIHIVFTPQAFLKCRALVDTFPGEVGWNGLMKKVDNGKYLVYDVIVYPQMVNGARTLDPTKTNEWYDKYDDVIDEMHFQAHSHVSMSTTASGTDIENQKQTIKNMSRGIMLFQIWNKQGEINSFLYDIDNQLMYDKQDVTLEVAMEGEFATLQDFIDDAKVQVEDIKVTPISKSPEVKVYEPKKEVKTGYSWNPPTYYDYEKTKMSDPFYWKDGNGNEGWYN